MPDKKKFRSFLAISATIFITFLSCKKKDIPDDPTPPTPPSPINNAPGQFTVSLTGIAWDTATINWTRAIDPDNDSVLYKVYLNDTLRVQNLNELSYTFKHLNEITTYSVKVVAVDAKSKETNSLLSFTTKNYWLRFLQKVEYGPAISAYSYQKAGQMTKANDGGYILVGDSQLGDWPYGPINMITIKIDSLGNKIWDKRYDFSIGNSSEIKVVNYNDGYILCGGPNVLRINNNGDIIWRKLATDPQETKNGVAIGSDGSIYVVGLAPSASPASVVVATLDKYDANGNLLFQKVYSNTPREEFYDVKIVSATEMIILGTTGSPDADFWVVKLSMDGTIIWDKTFEDVGYAFPKNIIKTTEGNFVLTGYSYISSSGAYFYLQMLDPNGVNKWTFFDGYNWTRGNSVIETNDQGLVVTGGFEFTYSAQSALYKFDKNGNKLWERLYPEFATYLLNKTVIGTSDGGYIMNVQKSKAYNSSGERDQIYIFKTDDLGKFN